MLRAHRESLLTVLEVVIHDPMYRWAMTPIRAKRRQQSGEEDLLGEAHNQHGKFVGGRPKQAGGRWEFEWSWIAILHTGMIPVYYLPVFETLHERDLIHSCAAGTDADGGGVIGNADAERAVLRVKQKLEGLDGGEGEPRSVAAQVNALLQEARDPERLCRMYVGWSPFM